MGFNSAFKGLIILEEFYLNFTIIYLRL